MEQGFMAPDVARCGTLQDSVLTLSAALDLRKNMLSVIFHQREEFHEM
jgi:hypothetical protein